MKRLWLLMVLTLLSAAMLGPAFAQEGQGEQGFLRKLLFVQEGEGLGGSAVANLGSFFFNGDYNLFSAGAGLGLS